MSMLAETFQKPKPILGTLQLLALPGAPGWEGRMDLILNRAEQEALALASGGVDGILLENTGDQPHAKGRLDVAGAIALAQVAQRVIRFTNLPVGISILPNDPETAMAIALNTSASFIRVPLLIGGMMTENGLVEGKLQAMLAYQQTLKIPKLPKILVDLSTDHWFPGRSVLQQQTTIFQILSGLIENLAPYHIIDGFILPASLLTPQETQALQAQTKQPLLVEDPELSQAPAYYEAAQGLLLGNSIKKSSRFGLETSTTVDMVKVEDLLQRLEPEQSWAQRMPNSSEDLALYQENLH